MKEREPRIAVVGTNSAGGTALEVLGERGQFADVTVYGKNSVGERTRFGEVQPVPKGELPEYDYVLLATAAEESEVLIPRFQEAGAAVIDFSDAHRMDEDVPLVVPPVNAEALEKAEQLVANPNCTTAILTTALAPIDREYGIERLGVTSIQSVSGVGVRGESELRIQAVAKLTDASAGKPEMFPREIAFSAIPEVGARTEGGDFDEEVKVRQESKKILDKPELDVEALCVRIGAFRDHGIVARVRTTEPVERYDIERLLQAAPALSYWPVESPTIGDATGKDDVLVGRLQVNSEDPHEVRLWIVGDNLRRGAATNAVEIAEALVALRGTRNNMI